MPSRDKTIKSNKERINRALLYIQENIAEPLSLETISAVASFSPFHFHRLFKSHVGETLSGYVRRVRLDHAARKLSHTQEPVTSIALSTGYETPAAFAKAFRQQFGKTPSEYKKADNCNKTQFRLQSLDRLDRQFTALKPVIRNLPQQKVLFVRRTGRYDKAADEAWSALMRFAYSHRLMRNETKMIGISHDSPVITLEDRLRYDACISVCEDDMPGGEISVQTIKGGKYAVFLHKGAYEKFGITYDAIFSDWLPVCGEKLRDAPCFEIYLNRSPQRTNPRNLRTEIYIPVT